MSLASKVIINLKSNFRHHVLQRFMSKSSTYYTKYVLQRLENRGLIKVAGDEVVPYLQGLITNDIRHLEDGAGSMYAMFLNTKGRVMYDSIIYRTEDLKTFLIECDKPALGMFEKHLKMFKVKRKIDIEIYSNNIWVLFDNAAMKTIDYNSIDSNKISLSNDNLTPKFDKKRNLFIYKDPRINLLGTRILCEPSVNYDEIIKDMNLENVNRTDEDLYRMYRYFLGVAEGIRDLPPGNCFPLEANADFLHGVSFLKGCYIGQELTARTHHTGVVRKRLMPLLFENVLKEDIPNETSVYGPTDNKMAIGKIRGATAKAGLGLLRVNQALEVSPLTISGVHAKTYRPQWWPSAAPKEKTSLVQEQ